MSEWTKDQSNQITNIYKQLEGKYEKEAYQKLFGGPQLSYLDAFTTLTSLIERQKKERVGGLESKVQKESASAGIFSGERAKYVVGLVTALALILGIPYVP